MTYYVRSTDGSDYKVGVWNGGTWRDGDKPMALRELHALNEPGAYVWGRSSRTARPIRLVHDAAQPGCRYLLPIDGSTTNGLPDVSCPECREAILCAVLLDGTA